MPPSRARVAVDLMDTAKLWDLAFKVRAELARDLMGYRESNPITGEVRLLGAIMAELRKRSAQGALEV